MHALEEKNNLSNELAAVKKKLEDFGNQKVAYFQSQFLLIIHSYQEHQHSYFKARNLEEIASLRIEVKQLRNKLQSTDKKKDYFAEIHVWS